MSEPNWRTSVTDHNPLFLKVAHENDRYHPGLSVNPSHPSITDSVKPDKVDFFLSPSENLVSPGT